MLYSTNLIAVVGKNDRAIFAPKRLTIWDTNSQTSRMDMSFISPITGVKLNKKRLIVIVQGKVEVYNFMNMTKLFTIDIINPDSKFSLCPGPNNCYFANAANLGKGEINLYDLNSNKMLATINAHKANIREMTFNFDGTFLATTSENVFYWILIRNKKGIDNKNIQCTRRQKNVCVKAWCCKS